MLQQQTISLDFIIPVYNRPEEVLELFESLILQTDQDFSIVIVEDGSTVNCKEVIEQFQGQLNIQYYYKENTGPGLSRNYGVERSNADYVIFVDSDCILPPQYVEVIRRNLRERKIDCFGGPDAAHESFSDLQKAINYAMTSFLTTGGIRGSSEKLGKYHPRSFNMGFTKEVYQKTGGFPTIRFAPAKAAGEDMDLSIQIIKSGFKTVLIPEAYVYHKRRTNWSQFFKQVYNFGFARVTINKRHPESKKPLHMLPTLFLIGNIILIGLAIFHSVYWLHPFSAYATLVCFDSAIKNNSFKIGIMSILTSYIQLWGYGWGYLRASLGAKPK